MTYVYDTSNLRPCFGHDAAMWEVCYNLKMMEQEAFEQAVKDVLANLYDYAALETHPLTTFLPVMPNVKKSRGEQLRDLILQMIDKLQPPERETAATSMAWRPYIILHGRYVEGLTLMELKDRLALSGRQLRREQGRALRAMTTLLQDHLTLTQIPSPQAPPPETQKKETWGHDFQDFEITQEHVDVAEVMQGVAAIFQRRIQSQQITVQVDFEADLPPILSDRVILRQLLLRLLSYALAVQVGQIITLRATLKGKEIVLGVMVETDEANRTDETDDSGDEEDAPFSEAEDETPLGYVRYWSQRLGGRLNQVYTPAEPHSQLQLNLHLPHVGQSVILVVDDQERAIRMFERFLSRSNVKVVGVKEADKVLTLAEDLQPEVITLDVMMPTLDGWEVLQSLQANPETQDIPVIICSVWNEPELAASLGAATFLKKPITRQDLLDALAKLGVGGQ